MLHDAGCDAVCLTAGFSEGLSACEGGDKACGVRVAGTDGIDDLDRYSGDELFSLCRMEKCPSLSHRDDDRLAGSVMKIFRCLADVFRLSHGFCFGLIHFQDCAHLQQFLFELFA